MRCLQQILPFFWLVVVGALRQREVVDTVSASPTAREGDVHSSFFVPERAGNKAEGKPLGPQEVKQDNLAKSKGEPEPAPVCTERQSTSVDAEQHAPSAGEASATGSLFKKDTEGSRASIEDSSMADAALEEFEAGSQRLAKILNSTRVYTTMVELCDHHVDLRLPEGYFLVRALVLARNLRKMNSSYPLVVLITDATECPLLDKYNDRVFKDLNVAFMRLPNNIFTKDVVPEPVMKFWRFNYPKAFLFAMEAFERIVYMDTETVLLRNSDDLFDLPEPRKIRANRLMQDCDQHPFMKNGETMATTNLLVVKPHSADFHAMKYQFWLARQNYQPWLESTLVLNQLFGGEVGRLEILPPADSLSAACLQKFNCRVGSVRMLQLGKTGNRVIDQNDNFDFKVELDHTWKPVFHRWAAYCHSAPVQEACNGNCEGLCLRRHTDWVCESC